MADPRDVEDKLSLSRPFGRRRKRAPRPSAPSAPDVEQAPADVPSGMPAPAAGPAAGPEGTTEGEPAWETGPALDSGPMPGFVPPLPPSREEPAAPRAEPTDPDPVEPAPQPDPRATSTPPGEVEPWRQRVDLLPMLPGRLAAIVTGVVVGLAGAGLTSLGLKGCTTLKGTSSCGGPGFFMLLAIVIVMVLLGAVLLTVWEVSRPGSTSILGVALVVVVSLLFLVDVLFSAWMFAIVPLLGAIGYLAAWSLTGAFAEEVPEPPS